jgi:beta-glucosidase
MREIYALPFEMAIRTAGMRGVMCAYNQIDGVPVQASRELLTDLLRGELGFDGLLISDLNSAIQLHTRHGVAESAQHAAALSLRAGLDFELGESVFGSVLVEAVRAGIASEDDVDRAVRSVLRWKFELGLFERPYIDIPDEIDLDSAADRDLARRVAEKSIVLLQNRPVEGRPLLPISDDVKRIAVIGPNADRVFGLLGNYTYAVVGSAVKLLSEVILDAGRRVAEQSDASPDNVHPNELADHIELVADDAVPRLTMVPVVTALDGIRARATEGVVIDYAHGCPVERADRSGIDEAIRVAAAADIAIVVVGDQSGILKAATVGESVDSASCALPGVQRELVEAVAGSGTPTIVVLTHGRPYVLGWMADAVPAIVSAWFPGEEGGTAIARVLFGDVNPSGRAPVTFHSRTDTLPMPYNRSHSPGNSYVDAHPEPVFPFGHGLSYTTFDYGDLAISPEETTTDGTVIISCTVTNTGAVSGEDVVQLYLRDPIARSSRPRRELKGFTRVALEPGAAARVTFSLSADRVALYDPTDGWVVEPGLIEVHVGRSSEDLPLAGAFTLRGTARATGRGRELVTPLTTAPLAP